MDGEGEEQQQKRVAPLSTVSLDSTYDRDDEGSAKGEKPPLHRRCSWTPLYLMVALILVAVGLVLALDREGNASQGVLVADEGDPWFSTAHAALTSGKGLTAPQKKLVAWLKQMQNASELYVEAGSSNMSLTGVVFPRNDSDEPLPLPFDAMLAIDSGLAVYSRQYVALANDKGYTWTKTQVALGASIATDGCLSSNGTWQLDELDSVVKTANWTSDDSDKSEVSVVLGGETYTLRKEGNDSSETESSTCWFIEREDEEFGLRLCIPSLGEELPKADFEEIFEATNGCPQLVPRTARTGMGKFPVPLPLRKWYASYKGLR